MMQRLGGRGLLLLLLAACGDAGARESTMVERDSAGVKIVENGGTASLPPLDWRVDESPQFDVGGDANGITGLYQVTDAARLADGRIVVANNGSRELHIYSATGERLRRVGREGDGPGEFRSVFWVGSLPGDSIAAWDAVSARLSVFTSAGEFVRSVTATGSLGVLPQAQGVLSDGRLVVATGAGSGGVLASDNVAVRDTLAYLVLGPDGSAADTVGRFPGTEMIAAGSPRGGFLMRPLPFGRATVAAVHGGRVYVGTADRYELAAYEPGRGLRSLVRVDREPVRVSDQDIREYRRTLVTLGGEGDAGANRRQEGLLEEAPYPRTMPSYTDLEADPDGNLWVQEPARPGDQRGDSWTVIDRGGQVLGTVRMPPGLMVKQIGSDWVLGVALDENHQEHARLYRLRKGVQVQAGS